MRWGRNPVIILLRLSCSPVWVQAQPPSPAPALIDPQPSAPSRLSPRWEITLDGQVGLPSGHLQVGETNAPGTNLRLRGDLGIEVSEAVQLSAGYRLAPRDTLRASFSYAFLDGTSTINHPVVWNGQTFAAGRFHTEADFWRATLAYERALLDLGPAGRLFGNVGLTYVHFNPKINGNNEDFYLQELPVPLLGLRLDNPLGQRLSLTASLAGGVLPRVDSLRKEGGTVFLQQSHADADVGLAYTLTSTLRLEGSYHLTYFTQHELSHEDNNAFLLLDNGFRLRLIYRF